MNHEEAEEALWDFYDGELAPPRRDAFQAHLAACAECRETLNAWRGAAHACFKPAARPTPVQTEAFVARVMGRVEARPWPLSWLWPAFGAVMAAASLFVVLALRPMPDPVDSLLSDDAQGARLLSWAAAPAPAGDGELLAFAMEDR